MTLYAVINFWCDQIYFCGVFESEELAKEAIRLNTSCKLDDYKIERITINSWIG